MHFKKNSPEAAGISSRHILDFLDDAARNGLELHSLMFLRHGKVFAEGWWAPYTPDSRHIMFSFTKSLTSTAIGFLRQEGKLRLEERLVDIFPEKLPVNPSENLQKCTVRDLLTMGCGHEEEISFMGLREKDWIASFLAQPFVYKPGSKFMYNTAGTNLLAAILKKKTGMNLLEFLEPRLFTPLGMQNVVCYSLPDGTAVGGAGSRLTTENMALFTQFVANRGVWNEKRLLEENWFDLATTKQIENRSADSLPNWGAGYGFQFWQCTPPNTFRGDGAFGQFGVVCKDQDAVLVLTSASTNFHCTLDLLWKHIQNNFCPEPLPEDPGAYLILEHTLQNLSLAAPLSQRNAESVQKYNKKTFVPATKISGSWPELIGGAGISGKYALLGIAPQNTAEQMRELTVSFTDFEMQLTANLGKRIEILPVSLESRWNSFVFGEKHYGAVGGWTGPDRFEFDARCTDAATGTHFSLIFSENGMTLASRPSIPAWGGLGDEKQEDILFQAK
ncbi:MAG: serine hydrolase [Oscillospiraceae bacterium]